MYERRLRLILVLAMFTTLFLPRNPDEGLVLIWIIGSLVLSPSTIRFVVLWYPVIVALNTWLVFSSSARLRRIYRIFLFAYLPLEWVVTLRNNMPGLQIGYWAVPAVVSAAALIEVFLILRGQRGNGKKNSRQ